MLSVSREGTLVALEWTGLERLLLQLRPDETQDQRVQPSTLLCRIREVGRPQNRFKSVFSLKKDSWAGSGDTNKSEEEG